MCLLVFLGDDLFIQFFANCFSAPRLSVQEIYLCFVSFFRCFFNIQHLSYLHIFLENIFAKDSWK